MTLMWIYNSNRGRNKHSFDATPLVASKWFLNTRQDYVHKACFGHYSRTNSIGRLDQLRIFGSIKLYLAFGKDMTKDPIFGEAEDFLEHSRGLIKTLIT